MERTAVRLEKCFFEPNTVAKVCDRCHALLDQAAYEELSERERTLLAQGASPNQVRLATDWFLPWTENVDEKLAAVGAFRWVIYPVQVRRMTASSEGVPWHQDLGYQRALPKAHERVITCFLPLDEEPFARSTLEFGEYQGEYLDHHREGNFDAVLNGPRFQHLHYYLLERGDCLLFGDLAPHRTFVPPDCERARTTIEYRLIQPEHALPGKDYFDISSGAFVTKDGTSSLQLVNR